jgi:cellulose/xylan binding protein with CBM9 domain/fibronectin type III domain protein
MWGFEMRLNNLAMGPVLAGCAVMVLTSCSTDDREPSPGLAPTISASTAATSAYDIVKVPTAMTIDGNLSEWANIAAISMADHSTRGPGLDNTAKVKLAWDDTYLYAAYDVTDTELLADQTTRDHPDIFKDDAVELYIDPQGDGSAATSMTPTDYQFLANVREALGDVRGRTTPPGGKDASFNASSFLARAVSNGTLNGGGADAGYTVELQISWADLGVTPAAGNFVRIDPVVDDKDTGNTSIEEFDWAGLTSNFNNPSGWKDVQLVNRPPPTSAYDIVNVPTPMAIDGSLAEWTGIAAISMADTATGWTGKNTAKVKLAWDPTYLYVAYDVTDTDLEALETARDAGNIYKDDEIEFYIDPQGDGWTAPRMTPTDYQFLANIRDALGDMRGTTTGGKDATYNAPSFLAKAVTNGTIGGGTDVGYTVEARVAWTDLGVTAAAGNFLRVDPVVGDWDGTNRPAIPEAFDWAGLTTYNNPIGWKDVKLAVDNTAPAAPTNLALAVVSSSQIDVSWTASTSSDVAKYNIYRSTSGTPTLNKTVTASPYHDTGLTPGSYSYQVSAVDAAGNESAKTPTKSATVGTTSGIPFGPFSIWKGTSKDTAGASSFTASIDFTDSSSVVAHINAARAAGLKIFLMMTDRGHSAATGPYKTNGLFDIAKWKDSMNTYDTPAIKAAVAAGVADGTILGNSVLDEPNNSTDSQGKNGWGPDGWMTKMTVDEMCRHAKSIFPTLPMGVVVVHWWKESDDLNRQPTQRPRQTYTDCEFIIDQYDWWQQANGPHSPGGRGDVGMWKDSALVAAARNSISIAFSMNILAGGVIDVTIPDPQPCPVPPSGGPYAPVPSGCKMTAAQVRQYGLTLGPAGCAMMMWKYDQAFMTDPANRQAINDVAADLAQRPAKGCGRPT